MAISHLFFLTIIHAQDIIKVMGRVSDKTSGLPIAGAILSVKGKLEKTTTDSDGSFKISLPSNSILIVSNVGYSPVEVQANQLT